MTVPAIPKSIVVIPNRGERRAQWMIDRLADAGVSFSIVTVDGEPALIFPDAKNHTAEQTEVAVDAVLFAMGYPRSFGTMQRLMRKASQ